MNKQELLDRIQAEADAWDALLTQVGEPNMEVPGATGEWTFKDVVAHLVAWRTQTLARFDAARRDVPPNLQFWPHNWDEEAELDKINAWVYAHNRHRPLVDVLAESRQQFRDLYRLVAALPVDALFMVGYFDWAGEHALADYLDFGHYHDEHEPALRRWLAKLPA